MVKCEKINLKNNSKFELGYKVQGKNLEENDLNVVFAYDEEEKEFCLKFGGSERYYLSELELFVKELKTLNKNG